MELERRTFAVRGRTVTHSFLRFPGVVVILAEDGAGRVLFVRQYRAALDRRILELPAGRLEPGEEPEAGARRELEEETGFAPETLRPLLSFWPAPGYSTERIWAFLADELRPTATHFDAGEDIELVPLTRQGWHAAMASGELADGKSLLTLLAWEGGWRVPVPPLP